MFFFVWAPKNVTNKLLTLLFVITNKDGEYAESYGLVIEFALCYSTRDSLVGVRQLSLTSFNGGSPLPLPRVAVGLLIQLVHLVQVGCETETLM